MRYMYRLLFSNYLLWFFLSCRTCTMNHKCKLKNLRNLTFLQFIFILLFNILYNIKKLLIQVQSWTMNQYLYNSIVGLVSKPLIEVRTAWQQISYHQHKHQFTESQIKITYFPHSDGGFHADKSISDLTLGRQFLTTKYFVVNRATPTSL